MRFISLNASIVSVRLREFRPVQAKQRKLRHEFTVWIIVGSLIGWVVRLIMKATAQQSLFLNVVIGIVGAMLAG